ncbi:hypothetical protein C8A01DRAFT_33049 [Parachaetomium inaequale]|uniref:Uncharacterized protein n=1 Tax=Parachaetomium inaequale TaxID=2588326 RepID=A0AAN6STR4_9PEZI|nr:hypothetical protein C8A01DRAFT_33049 [Parachaetomium inaequale]
MAPTDSSSSQPFAKQFARDQDNLQIAPPPYSKMADIAVPYQNLDHDGRDVERGPVAPANPALAADLDGPNKGAECYSLVYMWAVLFRFLVYMTDGLAASVRFLISIPVTRLLVLAVVAVIIMIAARGPALFPRHLAFPARHGLRLSQEG